MDGRKRGMKGRRPLKSGLGKRVIKMVCLQMEQRAQKVEMQGHGLGLSLAGAEAEPQEGGSLAWLAPRKGLS